MTVVAAVALALAAGPAMLFLMNLFAYRRPRAAAADSEPTVSVVVPARNEAEHIEGAVRAALAAGPLEVIVVDDHSTDDTGRLVAGVAAVDPRVRLVPAPPLPTGWCGKPHACQIGADAAAGEFFLFVDADVRLRPGAIAALVGQMGGAAMASGVPRQVTGGLLERLLVPLIHFVLLGFLPVALMRRVRHRAYGAACGQLVIVRRTAYQAAGGHAAVRGSRMDGLSLPRAFRAAGFLTDLCDVTDLADCRMYTGPRQVWAGLVKNADEGLGAPGRIVPATALLVGGQVLPFALLTVATEPAAVVLAGTAAGLALLPRLVACVRFRQPLSGALLHPLGILLLLVIQWQALGRRLAGRPAVWRGRTYGC